MRFRPRERFHFLMGTLASLTVHVLGAVLAVLIWEHKAATATKVPEVFTVTLEGGEKLGGITQIPKDGAKTRKPLLDIDASPMDEPAKSSKGVKDKTTTAADEKLPEKSLTAPSVVDDPEKLLAEKRKLEEQERLKKQQEKEKKLQEIKKKEEEAKRKEEEELKREAADKKKKEEDDKKARDRQLAEITKQIRSRYAGESYNAGGTGFGAARLGGTGMGGGTLAPAEKIAYADQLQQHVKTGWHWLPGGNKMRALVRVRILPSGHIQDVQLEESSGNNNFDDSVVRAVRKASPVPPPPEKYANDFSDVRFWFDSQEQQ